MADKKTTLAELEKILEENDLPIDILPNGEIRVREGAQKFTIGDYTLEVHPGGRYWIRNKEGEGSEVSQKSVEKMFKRLFEENFII